MERKKGANSFPKYVFLNSIIILTSSQTFIFKTYSIKNYKKSLIL